MPRLLSLALVAALALAAACKDALGPDSDEKGTYLLESVNRRPLPAPLFSVEVVSGSVTLDAGGSYHARSTVRGTDNFGQPATQTSEESGHYTRDGTTLQFISTLGDVTIATYDGPTLTVSEQSVVMVYRRE